MVGLVAVPQALQDVDGQRDGRLGHLDRLEPALQGGVLLDVLAVLVEGGGADGLELATGQHGFEDAGGVDGPLSGTGTDEGVDLVDEQHDVAAGFDLLEHLLQAFLEIAAVAGTGDQGTQVEGVDLLVAQGLGHVAADDGLAEALDDGGLADARFADQHRVVLGATAEHRHDALDLADTADHRVEPVLARRLGEVAAELVEHLRAGFLRPGLRGARHGRLLTLVSGQQLDDGGTHPAEIGPELQEHLGGHSLALPHQPEQDVLGADVVVVHLQGLAQRELQHALGAGREGDVPGWHLLPLAHDLDHLLACRLQGDSHLFQRLGGHALALVNQTEKQVFRADVVVV